MKQRNDDLLYRVYLTDTLYYQGRNKALNQRYFTLVENRKQPVDKRTAEEIAADIIIRAGLKMAEGGGEDQFV